MSLSCGNQAGFTPDKIGPAGNFRTAGWVASVVNGNRVCSDSGTIS
jgi:hypothetical protein